MHCNYDTMLTFSHLCRQCLLPEPKIVGTIRYIVVYSKRITYCTNI